MYQYLRYGVPVRIEAGKPTDLVHLIDWQNPHLNDFAIAEEVTLKGGSERRPDLVLCVILVHELIHFQARRHDDRFIALMDAHLPNWRHLRQQLNSMPLAHEDWDY